MERDGEYAVVVLRQRSLAGCTSSGFSVQNEPFLFLFLYEEAFDANVSNIQDPKGCVPRRTWPSVGVDL
jgi:hypothetical protein